VPESLFGRCLDRLPQICVEPLLVHDGAVLLARRTNEPAAGEWFWPGGRLYKGERLDDQHDDSRFVTEPDADCHEYVREYFRRFDLPE